MSAGQAATIFASGNITSTSERSSTQTTASIAPLTAVQQLSAANPNRLAWSVYNASTAVLFVSYSASGAPAFASVAAGATYSLPAPATGAIYGIFSAATGSNAIVTDYAP